MSGNWNSRIPDNPLRRLIANYFVIADLLLKERVLVRVMKNKSKMFIWESVIGLGFLSGIWTAIGINPQTIVIGFLEQSAALANPDPGIRAMFILLPTILLGISIISAYRRGKTPGLFSVVIAYISGLLILTSTLSAVLLLLCAAGIGILATR